MAFDHEAIVQLFRNRPELARELVAAFLPAIARRVTGVDPSSTDLGDAKPLARTADFVARLRLGPSAVRLIIEVQLSRDQDKRRSWPGYVGVSWAQSGEPSYLVVVAPDSAVAAWPAPN